MIFFEGWKPFVVTSLRKYLIHMFFLWMIQFRCQNLLREPKHFLRHQKPRKMLSWQLLLTWSVLSAELAWPNLMCIASGRPCILHPTTTFHIYLAYLDYKNWLIHLEKLVVQDALLQLAKNWPRFPPLLLSTHSVLVTLGSNYFWSFIHHMISNIFICAFDITYLFGKGVRKVSSYWHEGRNSCSHS